MNDEDSDQAFRDAISAFFCEKLPADLARRVRRGFRLSREDSLRWQRILYDQGWAAPNWPKEHGGPGWTLRQRLIYEQERERANAPIGTYNTIAMLGPVLYNFGTEEQKQRFIPPILRGESFWCQGFSEPEAGSDLASLKTRAERQGDHYLVNGSKIWTTNAHQADWIFMLVRTSSEDRKQAGISFLLADMKSPGISVRSLPSIDGGIHLNETFFANVRVPVENLIGQEGQGWSLAKALLGDERAFAAADLPALQRHARSLKALAVAESKGGSPLIEDRSFARKFADLQIQLRAIETSVMRLISGDLAEGMSHEVIGSMLKIKGTELQQKMTELLLEAIGDYGAVFYANPEAADGSPHHQSSPGPDHAIGIGAEFFYKRAASIYGGTNEIQRGIIAKHLFQFK